MSPTTNRLAATRLGRRNGNFSKNLLPSNSQGKFSVGLANIPPKEGPNIEPIVHTRGMTEKAIGCSSFSGTISATMVRIMPTERISCAHMVDVEAHHFHYKHQPKLEQQWPLLNFVTCPIPDKLS